MQRYGIDLLLYLLLLNFYTKELLNILLNRHIYICNLEISVLSLSMCSLEPGSTSVA